ncbi:phenylalanine--tRNA ligase subunit beta [Bombilactobacillus bombi]|uniref:phenylalanine--tRNA ligase subunit beta n=1 Tax=Bombilactobacillus bombi TaxID=1303590 RepID=UPI000E56FF51|nr:phenylalanine--tRNA ligase subunit beta [Bombilactobacillus bombi]AXX64306.1 phenylalanine--tRNA ligase subunit beta [Bombilactobacillus bombi]
MKISTNWLAEYVNLPETPAQIAERETVTGIEVDEIIQPSAGLKKLVVGKIMQVKSHPDADHLHVCQVDVGQEQLTQIVCGAPNVQVGQLVIVALPGARIAHNEKIKKGKFRGVESLGMLCALQEIGFDEAVVPDEYKDGIYVFPADSQAKIGEPVFEYLGMDDTILDFDITPNRADTLGMRGTAWEVAAMYDEKPHFDQPQVHESDETANDLLTVKVADENLAPTYRVRIVKNVQVQASPLWLQRRLWNNGIKPINNVVDITNYVMLEYGQPLHAYDYDRLNSKQLIVRLAQAGEQITALNGNNYELDSQDIVIADEQRPLGLAGIMGGNESKIASSTTTVVLESGVFDSIRIRKTAQRHNLRTDASTRFEKGVDLAATAEALDEAASLLETLGSATVLNNQIVGSQAPLDPIVVQVSPKHINHVLGTDITTSEIKAIMERLGFAASGNDEQMTVTVPLRRWDISIEADIIEEVVRIYGFDKLPSTLPVGPQTVGGYNQHQQFLRRARSLMRSLGYDEAISYALTTQEKATAFSDIHQCVTKVDWPMTHDHEYLRLNLISGLLDDILYNVARKQINLALFEQGRVFPKNDEQAVRPHEVEFIAGAVTGNIEDQNWQNSARSVDFFAVKGDVDQLLQGLNKKAQISYQATDSIAQLHPGQTALILMNEHVVGFIGTVHPGYAKKLGLPETVVFQLNLDEIEALPDKNNIYIPAAKFPAVTRDIAILVPQTVTHAALEAAIAQAGGKYLTNIKLFDIYAGKNIKSGYKSVAYDLTFQNREATLTDQLVNQHFERVKQVLQEQFGAEIR